MNNLFILFKNYLKLVFRWQKGRQQTGYSKMLLLYSYFPLPFDIYLLKYEQGAYIPPHTDLVSKGRHFRCNIILWNSSQGGEFICQNMLFSSSRIKIFRPDISEHSVTLVEKGRRYVLSIGWIKK